MRTLVCCLVLVFAGFAAADDKKEPKGEEVKGKIAFEGKPLAGVIITFTAREGKTTIAATTDDEGAYTAKVPVGEYKLTVANPPAKKADPKDPPKKDPPKPVAIPEKYSDRAKTPLLANVVAGKQTLDLDLKK